MTKIIKNNRHVRLRTKGVKLVVNEKIEHTNKKNGHVNKSIQSKEFEGINIINTIVDKYKQTTSA